MKTMKTLITVALTAALLATSATAARAEGAKIFVIGGKADDPFWSIVKRGAEDAGKVVEAQGGSVTWLGPQNYDNLYKWIHSVHHNSVNPSPWSSLSMHPIEHLLYWSDSLIHLVLPSHPLLLLYNLQITGTGAVVGHVGFDKIEVGNDSAIDTHAYVHYLHHKHFEVNYADGTTALDKLFGTWHDGTKEGEALMQARYEKKVARINAKK
jgi:hypothetical protein